jgi:hypothetical protein
MNSSHEIDASWDAALQIVQRSLHPSSHLVRLTRLSWEAPLSPKEFAAAFGVVGLPATPIIRAAQQFDPSIENLDGALRQIGPRAAAVVATVYFASQEILHNPRADKLWIPTLRYLMNHVEVGYHVGLSSEAVGPELGMTVGFSQAIGISLLVCSFGRTIDEPRQLLQYEAPSVDFFDIFGCEPHQVSSLALQRLGYGSERASSAAIALGSSFHHEDTRETMVTPWRAASDWISALLGGQTAPADPISRDFIPELIPHTNTGECATHLSMFHEQIQDIRINNSAWHWHLPADSYKDTNELVDPRTSSSNQSA